MFEQKAQIADRMGAAALIIVNTDAKQRFVMAPMQIDDVDDDDKDEAEDEHDGRDESGAVDDVRDASSWSDAVPTLMVSKDDGEVLLAATGQPALVQINKWHQDLMSGPDAAVSVPSIRVAPNAVQVLGRHGWGMFLTSQTGANWQLFIVKNDATEKVTVGAPADARNHRLMRTAGGQYVCVVDDWVRWSRAQCAFSP